MRENSYRGLADRCSMFAAAGLVLLATACGVEAGEAEELGAIEQPVYTGPIDARRSLAVTDLNILSRFSLERVLTQLAVQSGVPGLTAVQLFQQWWDTQNPGPGLYEGAHCDDQLSSEYDSQINGYPYFCRSEAEGTQAECNPFAPNSACAYIPIGLFNRFDQALEDGSHCGEHRIVYAKQSGLSSTSDRNLLIFEAALMNPHPQQGAKGCKKIADIWASLTPVASQAARANALERFYFQGQGGVPPVVSISHFGDNALGIGQIRTNQFSNTTTGWSLREFKLMRTCSGNACSAMRFVPVTNKTNIYGALFAEASTLPEAPSFQSFFPTQVGSLAGATSVPDISMKVPDVYNSAQSQASGSTAYEMRYLDHLGAGPSALRTSLQAALTAAGSTLTPEHVVLRAQTQSCAGCHRLSNSVPLGGGLVWQPSLGFTHVTERETEVIDGVVRYRLSDALVNELLPRRTQILRDFLSDTPRPSKGPKHPLSGSASHG